LLSGICLPQTASFRFRNAEQSGDVDVLNP
jgi:hypothetical protein